MPNDPAISDVAVVLNDLQQHVIRVIKQQAEINGQIYAELHKVTGRLTLLEKNWE